MNARHILCMWYIARVTTTDVNAIDVKLDFFHNR